MTYRSIVDRVADNLGIDSQSSRFLAITKSDILDVLAKVYRKVEPIKAEKSYTLTTAAQETALESDFFIPLEIIFNDSDGARFASKELTLEEFLRWNPDVEQTTVSFSELITSATPQTDPYTQENFDFDGLVGYVISDEATPKLKWKPAIAGTATMLYAVFPTAESVTLTESPAFHKTFHELIVLEITIKHLVRRLSGAKDQIELIGIQSQISNYKRDRDETLSNLNGFVNRMVSTPVIEPFNFLNSSDMIILTGD